MSKDFVLIILLTIICSFAWLLASVYTQKSTDYPIEGKEAIYQDFDPDLDTDFLQMLESIQ